MIFDELETYINRKELSGKAIKEVVDILTSKDYSSEDDFNELLKILLKLRSEVIFSFVTSKAPVISESLIKGIGETIVVDNPVKSGHIYAAVIAFAKINYLECANNLLRRFVVTNIKGKLDKRLSDGFKRVICYGFDTYIFSKLEGWDSRELMLYGRLLTEASELINNSDFTAAVAKCFELNGININLSADKIVAETDAPVKSPKASIDSANLDLGTLTGLLIKKISEIEEDNKTKGNDLFHLRSENLELKNKVADLTSRCERVTEQNNGYCQKIVEFESIIRKLKAELEEAESALSVHKERLDNVESAFGQAGQTEIDALKGAIKQRIAPEYAKYRELLDKDPDMAYYEILLAMLNDIFRALKKNGISF